MIYELITVSQLQAQLHRDIASTKTIKTQNVLTKGKQIYVYNGKSKRR